jgi:hypothetical protein
VLQEALDRLNPEDAPIASLKDDAKYDALPAADVERATKTVIDTIHCGNATWREFHPRNFGRSKHAPSYPARLDP